MSLTHPKDSWQQHKKGPPVETLRRVRPFMLDRSHLGGYSIHVSALNPNKGFSSFSGYHDIPSNANKSFSPLCPSRCEISQERLLKRGLFGVDPCLEELHGENEACLIARARARLLLVLADCSAMLPSEGVEEGTEGRGEGGGGGAEVLRRVQDAADCILGEVLQVTT